MDYERYQELRTKLNKYDSHLALLQKHLYELLALRTSGYLIEEINKRILNIETEINNIQDLIKLTKKTTECH